MIRILIADDHPLLRDGIRRLLEDSSTVEVIGEAGSGREAIDRTRELRPDVVVLDLAMADGDGLEALRELKELARVLIFSMHSEEQYARRALREGAHGYLNKKAAPDELERALHQIHSGELYVSPAFAGRLAAGLLSGGGEPPHELLSMREMQVFRRLGAGHPQTEIAEELGISVKTVSTHRTRVLEKLGLKSTAELVHYAISHRLVLPDNSE